VRKIRIIFGLLVVVFVTDLALAQVRRPNIMIPKTYKRGFKYFMLRTPWRAQLGWSMVDDDGKYVPSISDLKDGLNVFAVPTKLSIEKQLNYFWHLELTGSYNILKEGKTVNGELISSNQSFTCFDLNTKYIPSKSYMLEPYALVGLGHTLRTTSKYKSTSNLNLGGGLNIWVVDEVFALNFQATAKFGLIAPVIKTGANYFQYSVGGVYNFAIKNRRLAAARFHLKSIYNFKKPARRVKKSYRSRSKVKGMF
jgi:hypothetical protein